jgi:hypothetical protein
LNRTGRDSDHVLARDLLPKPQQYPHFCPEIERLPEIPDKLQKFVTAPMPII